MSSNNDDYGPKAAEKLARQQKIIVALFLCLGKSMNMMIPKQRDQVFVRESEIAEAWKNQKSPVRLVSTQDFSWEVERTFKVVLGELDLTKTGGMDFRRKMPAEPAPPVATEVPQRRVFDLE